VADHLAAQRLSAGARSAATGRNHCAHCKQPLNRSLYGPKKAWKSCPRCSSVDGSEHVFYEYPSAFGTSDARVSDDTPDEEVFNGPGRVILERYASRKGIGVQLLSFPIAELRKLSATVPVGERIPSRVL
jgi:hypothetical protein